MPVEDAHANREVSAAAHPLPHVSRWLTMYPIGADPRHSVVRDATSDLTARYHAVDGRLEHPPSAVPPGTGRRRLERQHSAQSGGRRRRCCSSARRWTRSASRRCCRFIVGSGVGAGLAVINCWFGRPGRDTSARRRSSSRVRHLSSSSSLIAPSSLCCRSSARAVRRTTSSNASDVRCVLFRSRRLAASCSRRAASDGHLRGRPRRGLAACSPCSATTAELSRISAHESCQGVTEDQRRLAPT